MKSHLFVVPPLGGIRADMPPTMRTWCPGGTTNSQQRLTARLCGKPETSPIPLAPTLSRRERGSSLTRKRVPFRACLIAILLLLPATLRANVNLPEGNNVDTIEITAQAANVWQQGAYEVWILQGDCRLKQGDDVAVCREAVFWIDRATVPTRERSKVIAYLEGNVNVRLVRDRRPVRIRDQKWFGRFFTGRDVHVRAGLVANRPDVLPGIYQRGINEWDPEYADTLRQSRLEQAQYVAPAGAVQPAAGPLPPGTAAVAPGMRRIRVFARGDVPMHGQWLRDPQTGQAVAVIDQGVTMVVEGLAMPRGKVPGVGGGSLTLDVTTDRLVIWTTASQQPDINMSLTQASSQPLEIYMEGNIVFRQGDQVIYADRMYYDVRNHLGTILGANLLTPAPGYEGKIRLHANVLQQTDEYHFHGQDAFVTSSRMGIPSYRLQMGEVIFEDRPVPRTDPDTGKPLVDLNGEPLIDADGKPLVNHHELVTAENNVLYVEDVPIFYWPTFAKDLSDPSFFIRRVQVKDDGVFGYQLFTDWAVYQLLGVKNRPDGTDWTVSLNYQSYRGISAGTEFTYDRGDFFGIRGPVSGRIDFWGIFDHGTDNLGAGRPSVEPEPNVNYRYRFLERHRQDLWDGLTFTAEVGKISDRNFMQEYFKQEWDEFKDPTTDVELKFRDGNMSMSLMAGARLDDFVTETQWLPRFDHYLLGQSLLADHLTWFEHTTFGYGEFKDATLPSAAAGDEAVSHLPWEPQNFSGGRFVSRNELDLPLELGPLKITPYVLGELGYWGAAITGYDANGDPTEGRLTRAYYQAGIRATLPMWAVNSAVKSTLWNIDGLAHKVEFDVEYLHAQSTQSMTQFPLYDPLDDWQTEDFRRRFVVNTFGLPVVSPPMTQGPPTKFDERYYALRTDMEGWVTAPSMEIADNLDELRLGIHQRWQTKRGPPDCPHIIDWMEFDTNITFFPDANRDNFGTSVGLLDYNYIWHVGDRLTLLSNGVFDFFGEGQKIVTVGMFLTRPPRGSLYAGFSVLEGPISSDVLSMAYSYWMSPKWIASSGMSIDLRQPKNFGPTLQLVRVGESMLWGINLNYNPALNTGGVSLTIEPRFVPKSGPLSQKAGIQLGQAGEFGVE